MNASEWGWEITKNLLTELVPKERKLGDLLLSRVDLWFQTQLNSGAETQSSRLSSSSCLSIFPHYGGFISRLHRVALATPRSHPSRFKPRKASASSDPLKQKPQGVSDWAQLAWLLSMPTLDPITVVRGPKSSEWPGQVNHSTAASQHRINASQSTGLRVKDRVGLQGEIGGLILLEGKMDVGKLKWQIPSTKVNFLGFQNCKLSDWFG